MLTTALVFVDGAIFGAVFATVSIVALLRYVLGGSREDPAAQDAEPAAPSPPRR